MLWRLQFAGSAQDLGRTLCIILYSANGVFATPGNHHFMSPPPASTPTPTIFTEEPAGV